MSTRQSDKKPGAYENCITVERQAFKPNAKASVKARNAFEKGKTFEYIPIFPRGYKMVEVKTPKSI